MKKLLPRLPALVSIVLFAAIALRAGAALAHKVNVFAVAEGGVVTGEGYFSGGAKAQSVSVEIQDASGAVIAQGVTETDGTFRIALPARLSPPLKVVLKAGDGHQNDFTLTAQDLGQGTAVPAPAAQGAGTVFAMASGPAAAASTPVAGKASSLGAAAATAPQPGQTPAQVAGSAVASGGISASSASLDEGKLAALIEAAVAKAVDEKLAPLKLQLARMAEQDQSARMREIIGGLGWIIGLVGIAAWFKRPKS